MSKRLEDKFYEGLRGEIPEPVVKEAEVSPAPVAKPLSSRSLFSHPDTHPVALDLALLKHFQLDWFPWLPETLFYEIEQTFKTSIAETNKLKIMAVKTLHVIDAFWEEWEIFEKTVQALNGVPPLITTMQPPDLPFLFAGVDMANAIRKEDCNDEIARYCAAIFLHEEVYYAPEPLAFCQPYISQPTYCCKDCDKCGSALPPFDGLCTSCAGYYTDDKPFNLKPDPEALKLGRGRNITLSQKYDSGPVKTRFEELNKLSGNHLVSAIREVPEDIQAAKLITATDFQNYRAQQLKDQLSALRGWLEMPHA